jgi:hypothetical protein
MPRLMDMTLQGPGSKLKDGARLSLDQFDTLVQGHLSHISEVQEALYLVCAPFKEQGNIRPVQCRRAIDILNEANEKVQEFCNLLLGTSSLPTIFGALRYRLLFVLRLAEEQIYDLIDLIESFRMICMSASHQVGQQRKVISTAFETLLLHITDISHQANYLATEAKFQVRRLISGLQEKPSANITSKANPDSYGGYLCIVNTQEAIERL